MGWDGVSHYTLDRPGLFLAGASFRRSAIATSSSVLLRILRNEVSMSQGQVPPTAAASYIYHSTLFHAEAGDTLCVTVTPSTTLPSLTEPPHSIFWATRVGPKRWT